MGLDGHGDTHQLDTYWNSTDTHTGESEERTHEGRGAACLGLTCCGLPA